MCGIAGIVGKGDRSAAEVMVRCLHHRGPDDSGIFSTDDLAIGMARLAILDLSPLGHQPMQSHCKRYWIVYNGECYNYQSIRNKLEVEGDRFISNSDTEVVLQAYVRWGAACLQMMNGMYAFAIWDTQKKTLFAARDRFGIKPFYYTTSKGPFLFSSEIKSLLASGYVDFDVDTASVFQYFTTGYIQQPATIISDVYALQPAHYLMWQNNTIATHRYWDFSTITPVAMEYEEAKAGVLEHLKTAVKRQMISDRPLGLFLSGGLDSASVLASMAMNNASIKSFSLAFEDQSVKNEGDDARELANHFGAEHHPVTLDVREALGNLDHYFNTLDQPSLDGFNTFLVSKVAAREITVALSGLGGDELFLGYTWQRNLLHRQQNAGIGNKLVSGVLNPTLFNTLLTVPGVDTLMRIRSKYGYKDLRSDYINLALSAQGGLHTNYKLLSDEVKRSISFSDVYKSINHVLTSPGKPGAFVEASYLTSKSFMSSQLLRDMDAASMAHSIEVRFPLIDHELFEFAVALPDKFKVQTLKRGREKEDTYLSSTSKRILLDTLLPYLPESFLSRKKNGFKVPLRSIINQIPEGEFKSRIFDSQRQWSQWIDEKQVQKLYTESVQSGSRPLSWWKILTFVSVLASLKRAADTGK
ncbi:MAG: asparagine synthase (glutamine-hydrolyzing) [Cyclobacteriaceae bacterium]|nr:asparagine synthase (glutamine-hydrolyzing) [Cyclobacteriaceae bacterium]